MNYEKMTRIEKIQKLNSLLLEADSKRIFKRIRYTKSGF